MKYISYLKIRETNGQRGEIKTKLILKEHANYETGICYESQFNFYNWINRIIKLYNKNQFKRKNKILDILDDRN